MMSVMMSKSTSLVLTDAPSYPSCNDVFYQLSEMGMGQNPIPLVNIKIAGKWMFIPLKMVCIGIDP